MYKFAIRVFGCQMNSYDGDRLRTAMKHKGWTETSDDCADVVILVTCCIREKAEQKVASEIGRYDVRYRKNSSPAVVLVGCMAQRIGCDMAKKFSCVRLVSGPRHLGLVPQGIEDIMSDGVQRFFMDDDPRALTDLKVVPTERLNPFKAYVTITYGCDRFCSYCIVPHVRGRLQSRAHEEILNEVKTLVANGVSEITLLGQNVDAYGKDRNDGYRFAALLKDVSLIEGIKRLRFATSHPKDFDEDILEVMASTPDKCRAITLPVQSGSDRIFQEMNRGYTSAQYLELVGRIRRVLPDVSLTTDLIVGFPGETEEDFQDTLSLMREVQFDAAYTFIYSKRSGTPAAGYEEQVPLDVKKERLNRLMEVQNENSLAKNKLLIGKKVEVLAEGPSQSNNEIWTGRTRTNKLVLWPVMDKQYKVGQSVIVEIISAQTWLLKGKAQS